MTSDEAHDEPRPPLGNAGEEAARLLEAVRKWVDDRGVSAPPIATGSAECKLCPICQVLSLLREGQPEVFEHVGHAMDSLMSALRAGISAHENQWSHPRATDVEHIDID